MRWNRIRPRSRCCKIAEQILDLYRTIGLVGYGESRMQKLQTTYDRRREKLN
ncbi:hypothetical protein M514_18187 [Trichuris suis]|uniref:Uncharacterized protein n=1 Tax=Trichuris suis TaxID=68888 RepID=A0A085NJC5_9BILA|nr:hypothetical protein M514_18187 [Trichuris suis]